MAPARTGRARDTSRRSTASATGWPTPKWRRPRAWPTPCSAPEARPGASAPRRPDAVLDALGEAVVVVAERLRIRSANGAAQRLLGRAEEELVGLECARVLGCR